MSAITHRTTTAEKILSLLILTLLAAICLALLAVQNRINPAVSNLSIPNHGPAAIAAPGDVAAEDSSGELSITPPAGILAVSPGEVFTPRTLSDKINGKAELYLSAGFERLWTRRYQPTTNPENWFEAFIYDMGKPAAAFAVFSTQRRKDAQRLPLAAHAYQTANALFFTAGRYYVELIAAAPGEQTLSMLTAFAAAYLKQAPKEDQPRTDAADPRDLFPAAGLVVDSMTLIAADAFGFNRLNQVYTARYQGPETEMTLFLSLRPSSEEARTLAGAYGDFLVRFGGTRETAAAPSSGGEFIVIRIMDAYEVIFSRGPYLAGVHMAENLAAAMRLAVKMELSLTHSRGTP